MNTNSQIFSGNSLNTNLNNLRTSHPISNNVNIVPNNNNNIINQQQPFTNNFGNQIFTKSNNSSKYISSNINPIKLSVINNTRPLRSFFPNSNYTTATKVDENLIIVQD